MLVSRLVGLVPNPAGTMTHAGEYTGGTADMGDGDIVVDWTAHTRHPC